MAGAMGAGLPERDLRLSPDHAVYIDGALFEAKALVNAITIVQETDTKFVTYHHIELEWHDIMLAEGLATESYLDTGNRNMFEMNGGAVQLYPDWRTPNTAPTCVPIYREGAKLEEVKARLLALAEAFTCAPRAPLDRIAC
jgi:collagen type I/II/III/V/XI/XXIV/XXVII alpha